MQKLFIVGLTIFVGACTKHTPLQIDSCAQITCVPIYGRARDWEIISDDLARNIYRHNKLCEKINNKY